MNLSVALVITRHRYTELQLLQAIPEWLSPPRVLSDGRRYYSHAGLMVPSHLSAYIEAHLALIGPDQTQGALKIGTTPRGLKGKNITIYGNRELLNDL